MNLSTPKQSRHNAIGNPLALDKYYAGFSPVFVKDAINSLNVTSKHIVLDPWAGQGTTAWITQNLGIDSILVDLNPVMTIYSAAADLKLTKESSKDDAVSFLQNCLANGHSKSVPEDAVPDWAPYPLWSVLHSVVSQLVERGLFAGQGKLDNKLGVVSAAAFLLLKSNVKIRSTSNPTHFRVCPCKPEWNESSNRYSKMLLEQLSSLLWRKAEYAVSRKRGSLKVYNGDSKSLPIDNGCIDFVITSPPYCTRIDYAKITSLELRLLDACGVKKVPELRREQMGSPAVFGKLPIAEMEWGRTCKSILSLIHDHDSHGSRNYYYKVFLKYFSDAFQSLQEIRRCMKSYGEGFLVVQNSYYKEIEIQLPKIYQEMFLALGFEAKRVSRNTLKNVIAFINSRSNQYKTGPRVYYEDVIHFRKGRK